ncbi:hypothetical protein YC2023_076034 [Brassica napus]
MGAGAVMWGRKTAHLFPLRGRSRTSVRDTIFWREIPREGGIKSRETEIAVKGPVGSGSGSPRPSNVRDVYKGMYGGYEQRIRAQTERVGRSAWSVRREPCTGCAHGADWVDGSTRRGRLRSIYMRLGSNA